MSLDDLLNAPLAPLRDDGFSARIVLRLERTRQRQLTLLWCMVAVAILPVLWLLPLEQVIARLPAQLDMNLDMEMAFSSPLLSPLAAMLVLFWAWRTRALRF